MELMQGCGAEGEDERRGQRWKVEGRVWTDQGGEEGAAGTGNGEGRRFISCGLGWGVALNHRPHPAVLARPIETVPRKAVFL